MGENERQDCLEDLLTACTLQIAPEHLPRRLNLPCAGNDDDVWVCSRGQAGKSEE